MTVKKFLFWSTVLSLPLLFIPKRRPGEVLPGPEEESGDGDTLVIEPSEPPLPFEPGDMPRGRDEMAETMPAEFRNFKQPSLPGYVRMRSADVPAAAFPLLRPLLANALGTVTKLAVPGRDIAAIIEPHYHPPGGATKPWGWHKGVSLWERKGQSA